MYVLPEPLKFGAYSERSTVLSHSITLWLVQRATSAAVVGCFDSSGLARLFSTVGLKPCSRSTYVHASKWMIIRK